MSVSVLREIEFLVQSILCGICITFVYDWLRIARNLWKHNTVFISIEDSLFWIACSIYVFMILHQENNGILRWFVVIGATIGMMIYKLTFSRFFVKWVTKIGKEIQRILKKLNKPVSILKKKLTIGGKLFKMMINKQ